MLLKTSVKKVKYAYLIFMQSTMPLKSEVVEESLPIISVVNRYLSTFFYEEGGPFIFSQVLPFLTVVANKTAL